MLPGVTVDDLITLKISNNALKSDRLPARLKILGLGANESTGALSPRATKPPKF